jgi:hypothetical protein
MLEVSMSIQRIVRIIKSVLGSGPTMGRVLQSQELGLLEHQHVIGRQESTQLRREFLSMLGVVGKGRWIVRNDAGAGDLYHARDALVVGEGGRRWRGVGEIERVLKDIGRGRVERAGGWE